MRRRRPNRLLAALASLAASSVPAGRGERLVASLSNHRVMVTSSFIGDELVLFGGIEQDSASRPRRGGYDIVVTVTGPRQSVVTFRKARVLGIWVNADSREFENAPAYLAVLSNRPLDAITNAETLRRLQLGLDNIAAAAARQRQYRGFRQRRPVPRRLHQDQERARTLPRGSRTASRSSHRRCSAPRSRCRPRCRSAPTRSTSGCSPTAPRSRARPLAFEVYKSGFEQVVTNAARDHGLLYGLATSMMAIITGWFASVVFRRD